MMNCSGRSLKCQKGMIFLSLILVICFVPGCAATKKKFTRQKDFKPVDRLMYAKKDFVKPYSNAYYYSNHFNMWKAWQADLMKSLDGNKKQRDRAADEALSHLSKMTAYLIEPQQSLLDAEIKKISWAINYNATKSGASRVRFTLERADRVIRSQYDPKDMAPFIKSDAIEL